MSPPIRALLEAAAADAAPAFRSALGDALTKARQTVAPASEWLGYLQNQPGVKKAELQTTGVADKLAALGDQPIAKTEIANHLAEAQPRLTTRTLSRGEVDYDPESAHPDDVNRFADEMSHRLFGVPLEALNDAQGRQVEARIASENPEWRDFAHRLHENSDAPVPKYSQYQLPGGSNYREVLTTLPVDPNAEGDFSTLQKNGKVFQSSHFDEPNILLHRRMNDRKTADGQRALHLEEVQSDWHQQGRQKGYRTPDYSPDNPVKGVPDAPFKNTWHELAMKQSLVDAVRGGYDALTWTTGAQQVDRYSSALRKSVDELHWTKTPDGVQLVGYKKLVNGPNPNYLNQVMNTKEREDALSDAVGKSMAQRILGDPNQSGKLVGNNIRIDSTGMSDFYDRMLPNFVDKYTKKLGGKVDDAHVLTGAPAIEESDVPNHSLVHRLTITPEIRKFVLSGQPLFAVPLAAAVAGQSDPSSWTTGQAQKSQPLTRATQ